MIWLSKVLDTMLDENRRVIMGYKIKEIREEKRMTQEELALKSGVSRQTISNLENNKSSSTTSKVLCSIARALGVSVSEIFFEDSV